MKRVDSNLIPKDYDNFSIHFARYKFVRTILKKNCKNILELGCGTGYGSAYLATQGYNVVAVDNDKKLRKYWENNYSDIKNLKFLIMENFKNHMKFDCVLSLEVIEHLSKNHLNEYLDLVKNCILPEKGIFICSTPKYLPMRERTENRKKNHIKEYKFDEFEKLLLKYFKNVFIFSQNDEIISTQNYQNAWNYISICTNIKI